MIEFLEQNHINALIGVYDNFFDEKNAEDLIFSISESGKLEVDFTLHSSILGDATFEYYIELYMHF